MKIVRFATLILALALFMPACLITDATISEISRPSGADIKADFHLNLRVTLSLAYVDQLDTSGAITAYEDASAQATLTATIAVNFLGLKSGRRYDLESVNECNGSMVSRAILLSGPVLKSYTYQQVVDDLEDNLILGTQIPGACNIVEADPIIEL